MIPPHDTVIIADAVPPHSGQSAKITWRYADKPTKMPRLEVTQRREHWRAHIHGAANTKPCTIRNVHCHGMQADGCMNLNISPLVFRLWNYTSNLGSRIWPKCTKIHQWNMFCCCCIGVDLIRRNCCFSLTNKWALYKRIIISILDTINKNLHNLLDFERSWKFLIRKYAKLRG